MPSVSTAYLEYHGITTKSIFFSFSQKSFFGVAESAFDILMYVFFICIWFILCFVWFILLTGAVLRYLWRHLPYGVIYNISSAPHFVLLWIRRYVINSSPWFRKTNQESGAFFFLLHLFLPSAGICTTYSIFPNMQPNRQIFITKYFSCPHEGLD